MAEENLNVETVGTETTESEIETKKQRSKQAYYLAEYLDCRDEEKALLAKVKSAFKNGRGILILEENPEGVKEGAGRTPIANKVKSSVKNHTKDSPSPYVGRRLTVVGFTEPKEPKTVERKVETVTSVEW